MQIDLVKQIEKICKNNGLTYYLIGGGCIGTIRHQGYIPWDDDLDVAMKRDDYNTFIEKASLELDEPYFLQTPITDPGFYRPFIRLRNSNGTCISKGDKKTTCNNGICIDIFPLDGYEDNLECRLFRKVSRIKSTIAVVTYNANSADSHKMLRKVIRAFRFIIFPFGIGHFFKNYNKKCTALSKKYPKRIGVQYAHFSRLPFAWDEAIFKEAEWKSFEYTMMPIPAGYDEMMRKQYGDYMKLPPMEKRGNKHLFEIEPDIPYKKYCHDKYGVNYK